MNAAGSPVTTEHTIWKDAKHGGRFRHEINIIIVNATNIFLFVNLLFLQLSIMYSPATHKAFLLSLGELPLSNFNSSNIVK